MKKFTIVFFLSLFAFVAFSQNRIAVQGSKLGTIPAFSKDIDTLMPMSFDSGTATFYITTCGGTSPDTGYVAGPNCYGDLAKAQMFLFDAPYNLTGCLVWIAEGRGTAGDVKFNVYNANGTGTAVSGTVNTAPGTVLSTVTKAYNTIAMGTDWATGINFFELTAPVYITGDYYVGLDFSSFGAWPANAFAIVTTTDGDAGSTELSWEKWDNNAWHSFLEAWPLDFDLAFFPIVSTGTDIQENYINNLIMNMYPNPVTENATVQYSLKNNASNVIVRILDITGKEIFVFNQGAQNAGNHQIQFDASQMAPGTYLYVIQAGRNRLGKKFIVE